MHIIVPGELGVNDSLILSDISHDEDELVISLEDFYDLLMEQQEQM